MSTETHWLDAARLRAYPRIFLVLFVLIGIGYGFTVRDGVDLRGTGVGQDFVTYWAASQLTLNGRPLDAYDLGVLVAAERAVWPGSTSAFPWFYPATWLLVVAPLALLPYLASLILFVASGLAAFVAALRRLIPRVHDWWLVAAFPGVWMSLAQGQNGLLTAALGGGALTLLGRRPVTAGVLIGLLAIKPQLAILFPLYLTVRRQWRALIAAGATASLFVAIATLTYGGRWVTLWFDSLRLASRISELHDGKLAKMPSPAAWLLNLGVPLGPALGLHVIAALAAIVVACGVWLRNPDADVRAAALVFATFLVLPYSFDYDLAWLAFPIAWLARVGVRDGWRTGEREVLVATWVLPVLLSAAGVVHLPGGLGVLVAGLWVCARRTWPRSAHSVPAKPSAPGRMSS